MTGEEQSSRTVENKDGAAKPTAAIEKEVGTGAVASEPFTRARDATSVGSAASGAAGGPPSPPPTAATTAAATPSARDKKFERILAEPTVNLKELGELVWSGCPVKRRPLCWKLLLVRDSTACPASMLNESALRVTTRRDNSTTRCSAKKHAVAAAAAAAEMRNETPPPLLSAPGRHETTETIQVHVQK